MRLKATRCAYGKSKARGGGRGLGVGWGGIQLNRPLTEKQLQQNEAVETEEEVQEQHCVKMK